MLEALIGLAVFSGIVLVVAFGWLEACADCDDEEDW